MKFFFILVGACIGWLMRWWGMMLACGGAIVVGLGIAIGVGVGGGGLWWIASPFVGYAAFLIMCFIGGWSLTFGQILQQAYINHLEPPPPPLTNEEHRAMINQRLTDGLRKPWERPSASDAAIERALERVRLNQEQRNPQR